MSIHNKTVRVTAFIKIGICFINQSSTKLPVRVACQKLNFASELGVFANFANAFVGSVKEDKKILSHYTQFVTFTGQ